MKQYLLAKENSLIGLSPRLYAGISASLSSKKSDFASLTAKLDALNPLSVLSRGFSAVFSEDGALVKSSRDVKTGDTIGLRLKDGEINAEVISVINKEN